MQWVPSPYPMGAVGIPSGRLSRYPEFEECFNNLLVPYGTVGFRERSYDAAYNKNKIVQATLNTEAEWLWLVDDDHVFDSDLLMRLLSRNVDVIAPACGLNTVPFEPVIFRNNGEKIGKVSWTEVRSSGLDTSLRMGNAGLLLKRHVLEKIDPPWFEPGIEEPGRMMEDINFSRKIVESGFTINVDCDHLIDHIAQCVVRPVPGKGVQLIFDREGRRMVITIC